MCTPNDLCLGISAHQDEAYAPPRPQSLGLPGSILLGPIEGKLMYLLDNASFKGRELWQALNPVPDTAP